MRLVTEEKDYRGSVTSIHNVSDAGGTLREILYRNRVSLYIKVLLYTVIKIVLMKQGFI